MSRATHAVVALPALDLRPTPDHRAELASQLLLGEVVRLLAPAARSGWWRVRVEHDGYEGWVRGWGIVPATAARTRRWRALATGRVVEPFVRLEARPGSGLGVGPLFLGSRVIPGRRRGGLREVELPDGRRGWAPVADIQVAGPPPVLAARVASLLGTPYLWGGRTPAGMDCSAFTQLVLAEMGVALPRDASQQHAACRPVPQGGGVRPGDLACFAPRGGTVGHVGLALGDGYFAHCRGAVVIASVIKDNALWDKELSPQFLGWFRPRRRGASLPDGSPIRRLRA